MSSNLIKQPYEMILDPTGGGGRAKPVANGKFYVGEIDKDPIANPRTDIVYMDESGQERPLTSPLTLNNSGAFVVSKNDGTIIQPYMKDGLGFSVLIQDARGRDVYSGFNTGDPGDIASANVIATGSTTPRRIDDRFADVVHVKDFGAVGDGVTDDTQAFVKAANSARLKKVPLVASSGTFVIKGSSDINIYYGYCFTGSTILATEYTGTIHARRNKAAQNYGASSSVVRSLVSSGTIPKGSRSFPGWANVTEVNNSYIIINTSQPFYKYRGSTITRTEYNRVTANGELLSSLKYSLDPSLITSIDVYPMEDSWTTGEGLTVDITGMSNERLLNISTSMFTLSNTSILDRDDSASASRQLLSTSKSANIKIDNVFTPRDQKQAGGNFSYTFNFEDTYDLLVQKCG